jgi:hypothetical protein
MTLILCFGYRTAIILGGTQLKFMILNLAILHYLGVFRAGTKVLGVVVDSIFN